MKTRGNIHMQVVIRITTSRISRRASNRPSRLRVPEASSALNRIRINAAANIRGAAAHPPACLFASNPAAAPAITSSISIAVVKHKRTSTAKSWL